MKVGFEYFIAKRILVDKHRQDRLSRPIVGIAILGIVIGVAVMILTLAITKGFQDEIRAKVIGSGSHIQISAITQTDPRETPRLLVRRTLLDSLRSIKGVTHIQPYATRAGILETKEEIEGVLLKGVGTNFNWNFFKKHLIAGSLLEITADTKNEVMISNWHAKRLKVGVDSMITIYLIRGEDVRPRKYRVVGVYSTGMEQIDQEMVLVDMAHIQHFAQWGVSAQVLINDSCANNQTRLTALGFGGFKPIQFQWPGTELMGKGPHPVCITKDSTIVLVVSDAAFTLADSAFIHFQMHPDATGCACSLNADISTYTTGGSHKYYAGGYELAVADDKQINSIDDEVYRQLDIGMRTSSVHERFPEIFSWLELLDLNVVVVIVLMIAVAIINMTSALLIIILERTSMIGVLKSLGSPNTTIRRIFLINAAYIMGIGIILGNIVGIGLSLAQQYWGIVKLPAASYYVDTVPIALSSIHIVLLDLGTLVVCLLALIIPTILVTRIAPAKAIKILE